MDIQAAAFAAEAAVAAGAACPAAAVAADASASLASRPEAAVAADTGVIAVHDHAGQCQLVEAVDASAIAADSAVAGAADAAGRLGGAVAALGRTTVAAVAGGNGGDDAVHERERPVIADPATVLPVASVAGIRRFAVAAARKPVDVVEPRALRFGRGPPVTMTFCTVTLPATPMSITRSIPAASIVVAAGPAPAIVVGPSTSRSPPPFTSSVPSRLRMMCSAGIRIVSPPLPLAHSPGPTNGAESRFAEVTASRSVHVPSRA